MAKETINAKQLTGINIYHTKNQTIYYNNLTKTAYIITNSVVSKWSTWSLRIPGVLFGTCMLIVLGVNLFIYLGLGLAAYGILTYMFYTKFLPSLAVNTNFKKPASQGFIRDTARRFELSSLFFISIICLVFALTTIFNIFRKGIPDLARNINIAIGVVFILIAAFFGYIAYIKKKENIKEN